MLLIFKRYSLLSSYTAVHYICLYIAPCYDVIMLIVFFSPNNYCLFYFIAFFFFGLGHKYLDWIKILFYRKIFLKLPKIRKTKITTYETMGKYGFFFQFRSYDISLSFFLIRFYTLHQTKQKLRDIFSAARI